ncbi:MAG: FMN-binding protein [[Eubacterium] sulci]|nr:FMN-binding protein [[Eubacterium] sulci]MBF1176175.1 FMN-binding protein [[Eubacterium] sulci]
MKKSKIAKVLAVSLSFTTVLSMFPGFAFANGDTNTKTIYGTKAVVEDDGTYRDYNTHIRVKIDQNGTIISVEDIDTASNIDRFAPESKEYWQKFVNGKGFDLFKGKTKDTLNDVDVNAISQATTSTKSVRDTIMYAFEVDEEKNELLAEVDEYGPASRYIAKDRDEAEKLIKEVKEKINSEELASNARRHFLNFQNKITKLKTSDQVTEEENSKDAGERTKDAIENLGTITADKKDAVESARQMYNALDRKGKKTVTAAVYQKLVKAEDEIFELVYKNNHKKLSGSYPIDNYGYDVSLTVYLSGDKIVKIEDNGTVKNIKANENLAARNMFYWEDTFIPNGGLYNYIGKTTSNYQNVDAISNATYTSDAAKGAIREALKKADENNLIEQIKTDVIKLEEKLDKNSGSALDKLEKDFESLSPESKTKLNDAGYGARIKALRAKFAALSLQPVEDEKDDPAAKHYTREGSLLYPNGTSSMVFTKAFNPEVKIAEKDGKTTYTVSFKESGMMGVTEKLQKLTVDGKVYTAKEGKDPYVSVFKFTRDAVDEEKIPVTVYSNMMKTSYDMNIVLKPGKTEAKAPETEKPDPGKENPGTEKPNPGKNDNADSSVARKYTRLADLLYPNGGTSMVFSNAFNPVVNFVEKDGKATYTVSFKEGGMMGMTEKINKLSVDGKTYTATEGKEPYISVFEFTRDTVNEDKIPVKVYSSMMGRFYDMKIVFVDEKTEVKDEEKPDPGKDNPGTEKPDPGKDNPGTEKPDPGKDNPNTGNQNAKKHYTVKGSKFLKPNGSDMKLMTEAFNPDVKLVEENGKATYTISFKKTGMMGITAELKKISVDGKEISATKGEGEYVSAFTFTRDSLNEKEIPVKIYIDVMNAWIDGKLVLSDNKVEVQPKDNENGNKQNPENPVNPVNPSNPSDNGSTQAGPSIKSGLNQTWVRGSQHGLVIVSDADISTFVKVLVDGKELVKDKDYQVVSGSTKVTLLPTALNRLSTGSHNVEIVSTNGTAVARFTIADGFGTAAQRPNTGDANTEMPIALAGLIGSAFIALMLKRKFEK